MKRSLSLLLLLSTAVACTRPPVETDPKPPPDEGLSKVAPKVTASRSVGAFVPSPARTVLTGVASDWVLVGTQGTPLDPMWFGLPDDAGQDGSWIRAGLLALNGATGEVRVYDASNGFPKARYADDFVDYGRATAPIADLTWLVPDQVFAAAAWEHLVKGSVDAEGTWHFTSATLRRDGQSANAFVTGVALAGSELFVGTDQGVAVVDPATLEALRWLELGVSFSGTWVYGLSAGQLDGPIVALLFGAPNGPATHVALVRPRDETARSFEFTGNEAPTAVYAHDGGVLVGVTTGTRGSIRAFATTLAGELELGEVVSADRLGATANGDLVPKKLAYDATRELLVVGGTLTARHAGGLVKIPAGPDGVARGNAEPLLDWESPQRMLLPTNVDVLHVDRHGRWYVAGRQLCSERKQRQSGLYRLEQEGAELRFVRPIVSGVHDGVTDPVEGHTWLALRDENPGIQCDGGQVQQGVCRLKADGSCELYLPLPNSGDHAISAATSAVSIAFGDPARRELALATKRDATFVRTHDSTRVLDTQIDPKLNLSMTKAAWGGPGALWLATESRWSEMPDMDNEKIFYRSPHGLGLLELGDDADRAFSRRYVRTLSDQEKEAVAGLPSSTVWDVLPLPGARRAVVACGIERWDGTYDHVPGDPSPLDVRGGIAVIDDTKVSSIPAPAGTTWGDVVALAKGPGGRLFALDAAAGLFELDLAARTARLAVAPAWIAPERALSLAIDDAGRFAVGTDRGVYAFSWNGLATTIANDGSLGYAWHVRFVSKGVLEAGTDHGLRRWALDEAAMPASLGPSGLLPRELWPLPVPCRGEEGCECKADADCAAGFSCSLCPIDGPCTCAPADPCVTAPGGRGCECDPERVHCAEGLSCLCPIGRTCACQVDPANCTGTSGCPCATADDCPSGFQCNAAGQCAARASCNDDCSCDTASGCEAGYRCEGGIAGNDCVPE